MPGRLPAFGKHPRSCGRQTKFENVNVDVTTVPTPKIPRATYPKMLVGGCACRLPLPFGLSGAANDYTEWTDVAEKAGMPASSAGGR